MNITRNAQLLGALGFTCGALFVGSSYAAIAVSGAGFNYAQNFDSLTIATTATPWVNDSTLSGWSLFRQPAPGMPVTSYAADTGSSNAGSFFSYGASGNSDRALGGLGSGGAYFGSAASGVSAGWIAVALTNTSAQALGGFSLAFNGEQWRNGGNTSAQTMTFSYGFGNTFTGISTWIQPGATFDWTSPVTGAAAAAIVGNTAGRVNGVGGSVAANWNAGETLWLRWTELNDPGNDHGLAVDDVSFTSLGAQASVPLPGAVWLLGSGLAGLLGLRSRMSRV